MRLGPYRVLSELGRGSTGTVYRALDTRLEREVALKVLAGTGDPLAVQRFLVEARAIARLKHPNVVAIHEVNVYAGQRVIVLELVPGSLGQRLKRGPLAPNEAARLVRDLARAVEAAHQAGILHRDLKPGNVLLDEEGRPRLTDFGLALDARSKESSSSEEGMICGTPAYMAPEQLEGKLEELGPWTDVWGLGAILHHALAGKPPFTAKSLGETFRRVQRSSPDAVPGIPPALDAVRRRALAKDKEARFASAAALANALDAYLRGEVPAPRATPFTDRDIEIVAALAAACLVLLLTAIFSR